MWLRLWARSSIAAPTMASAETVVIRRGGHHHDGPYGARAEYGMHRDYRMHRDHGWHRGWRHHGDRVVVVKRSHRHWD